MKDYSFKEQRSLFYSKLPEYWADLYGQEYSLYDINEIDAHFVVETREFAQKAGHIFFRTAELLQSKTIPDDTFFQMGFPKETIEFIRLTSLSAKTVIGRFDSVVINGKHKLLEFNADTPTFIYELFRVNGLICKEFNYQDPNHQQELSLMNAVNQAVHEMLQSLGCSEYPNIVFTSHGDNVEDRNTVLYLQSLLNRPSQYVPLHELRIIKDKALLDPSGKPIDILYRQTFPIESLLLDRDPDTNERVGEQLLDLVARRKLGLINPPSAFLLQNKAVMSVIWGLHMENSPYFSAEEHRWIEDHFLPTYLEPDYFIKSNQKYVKKPVFGREGDTIEIFNGAGEKIDEDKHKSYTDYLAVYQKFVALPTTMFQTELGEKQGHIMVGTFLINGHPSAFGFRVGDQITNNLSYFLPVGIKK
ncbi:glutathionylspermidine synthase family protein [Bacillus salitolerans]|uniref:Glutathionylspermidine synthase family protein n=1 Tax=Bacillus salitolerans TaxID=1437434 RepID=A0ABW4LUH6_9BACI